MRAVIMFIVLSMLYCGCVVAEEVLRGDHDKDISSLLVLHQEVLLEMDERITALEEEVTVLEEHPYHEHHLAHKFGVGGYGIEN